MAKNIKYIFFVSSIMAILFSLFIIYLIFPAFETVLIDNIKDEAVRIGKHFSPLIISASGDELKNRDEFADDLQVLAQQFNIAKIKVFAKSGEIIYSSSPEEIGKINNKNNNQRKVEVSAYPITDEEGNIIKFIHISRDITERKQLEQEREKLISELKESLENIKTLKGLIPICASCKKIRNDEGFWNQFETYISEHSDAQFSHGICPDCMKELYPEYHKKV